MAATLGGARKMRDAALAAVAGLFLLGALAGGGRRTSTELMSVAYGLLPISERVSFSQAAAQCPVTEEVRAGVWAAVCPTGDELMWCSRTAADTVDGDEDERDEVRKETTRFCGRWRASPSRNQPVASGARPVLARSAARNYTATPSSRSRVDGGASRAESKF